MDYLNIESNIKTSNIVTSFWHHYCYCYVWTDFTHCSDVSIVNFEQANADWVMANIKR